MKKVTDCVIRVESLSKKYLIRHRQRDRHSTIKDALTSSVKSLGTALRKAFFNLLIPGMEEL
jgi:hypothetical protein